LACVRRYRAERRFASVRVRLHAAGGTVFVQIRGRIARHTPSDVAALAFFVANFDSDRDIDPSNDLAVARILITNG
jgi:hypothetical protein